MELKSAEGIPPRMARMLANQAITTPEQLVAAGARPHGIQRLAALLRVPHEEIGLLIDAARAVLPRDVVEDMETPPRRNRHMGLLVDEERNGGHEPTEHS